MNPLLIVFACLFVMMATACIFSGILTRPRLTLPSGWAEDLAHAFYNLGIGCTETPCEPGEAQWEVVHCEDDVELQNWLNDERFTGWSVQGTIPQPNGAFTLILSRPLPAANN